LPAKNVWYVAFSRDDSLLVTAGEAGVVQLWNLATGTVVRSFEHHGKDVSSVSFGADGTRLVTSSADRLARIWDVATGKLVAQYEGHQSIVRTGELGPGERMLVTAGYDGTVRVWDVATGRDLALVGAITTGYFSAHFHPTGGSIVVTSHGIAGLWRVPRSPIDPRTLRRLIACRVPPRLQVMKMACDDPELR
jgi:WD40 repeat protein